MPTADSIRRKQLFILRRDLLDGDSGLLGIGGFRSIGGHSFLKKKQWELFCQQEQAASEFLPGVDDILTDSEVAEIQSDFLSLWGGKVQSGCGPQIHFYNWLSRYLENGEVVTGNYEYRGHTSEIVYPDQLLWRPPPSRRTGVRTAGLLRLLLLQGCASARHARGRHLVPARSGLAYWVRAYG
mmetsp:Transcript_12977/g.41422  ORF Transcript_12977/g.41422 Transcript_12977/m.41422 type:complete len:183 (+) Transcript_12977:284-832(+)